MRELRRVEDHVNRLLERLALALDVERALAANAAHELRTPLAGYGLGLSIVATIAEKHDARLVLSSPLAGEDGGFEARLEFAPTR